MQSRDMFSVSLLIGSALCLAIGTVITKALLGGMSPFSFLAVQLSASVCFLWSIILFQGLRPAKGESLLPLVLVGLVIGAGSIFTILSLKFTTASQASLIFATQPVLIMAFAWPLLGERPGKAFLGLGVLAVAGVVAAVGAAASSGLDKSLIGNAFAFLSTVLAALYVVWMRGITSRQNPLVALAVLQTVAVIVSLFAWPIGERFLPPTTESVSALEWMATVCTGIIYYGLAFWLYLLGLQKIPASLAGLYLNLVPVFTIGLAFVVLDEVLTGTQWIGAAIVLVAVSAISLLIVRGEQVSGRTAQRVSPKPPK